jgi:hypothetical protein
MPDGIAISDDAEKLLVTSQPAKEAILIDATTLLPIAYIKSAPGGCGFRPPGQRADAAN